MEVGANRKAGVANLLYSERTAWKWKKLDLEDRIHTPLSFSNESVLGSIASKKIALDQGKNVNISIILLLWAVSCQRNITINYRPQRSWAKVIFLHLSVILFTAGVSASPHPPRSRHPTADTSRSRHPKSRHPPEQTHTPPEQTHPPKQTPPWSRPPEQTHPPGSRHTPLGADIPPNRHPRADTPQSRHTSPSRHTPEQTHPQSRHTPPLGADIPPRTDTPGVDNPQSRHPP